MLHARDSKKRSFVKAISWRVVALIVLGTVSYSITGSWEETSLITIIYTVLQIFIYFVHERLWDRITWGKPNTLDTIPPIKSLTPEEQGIIINRLRDLGYIE